METAGNLIQQPLPILTEIIVGGIKLIDRKHIDVCQTLQDAIWLSMTPQLTGRRDRVHTDYARALGMSRSNFSKKINGGNIPHDFLVRLSRETGNALTLQWQAAQIGCQILPVTA